MHRLVQRLVVLSILIGALIFLALPEPALADTHECDDSYSDEIIDCGVAYQFCLVTNPHPENCAPQWHGCLYQSQYQFGTCSSSAFEGPRPLPVIDEARSQCYEACQTACADIPVPGEKLLCLDSCGENCDDTYPKQ